MRNLCALSIKCGIDIGIDAASLDRVFDEFTKSFEEEFDYRLEARNMKLVRDNLLEGSSGSGSNRKFSQREVKVPVAVLDKTTRKVLHDVNVVHMQLPTLIMQSKLESDYDSDFIQVLTMERLRGEPIKRRMKRMTAEMAAKEGKTLDDFEAEMRKKYEDPLELKKLLQQRPPTGTEILLYKAWLRAGDVVSNVGRLAWNCLTLWGLLGTSGK